MPDIPVYLDSIPNLLKTNEQKKEHVALLKSEFGTKAEQMVERHASLPPILTHLGKHTSLLREARELFIDGRFYSCVAMCGLAVERIAKDLFIGGFTLPEKNTEKLINELEKLNFSAIVGFLEAAEKIDKETAKKMRSMGHLRDEYIHVRGPLPEHSVLDNLSESENRLAKLEENAKTAIEYRHKVLSGTFSVYKDYTFREGKLVAKSSK